MRRRSPPSARRRSSSPRPKGWALTRGRSRFARMLAGPMPGLAMADGPDTGPKEDQRPRADQHPGEDQHIVGITLDERTVVRRNADIEHERAVAIFDLLEENEF